MWSTSAVTAALFHPAKTAIVAARNDKRPPAAFELALARRAIAPLIPAPAKFAKYASPSVPSQRTKRARPASIVRVRPPFATAIASARSRGIRRLRTKSLPVPRGRTASSTSPARPDASSPLTTSCTEPSPPTTTTTRAPSVAAWAASSARWPGAFEISASPARPAAAARRAISGQRRPVDPFAEAGLTRKANGVRSVLGRRRRECDLRHAVDRGAELLVGDAGEHALDDDVADGEEAARVRSADRADREQRRGLHLDREDAALRPALVLPLV